MSPKSFDYQLDGILFFISFFLNLEQNNDIKFNPNILKLGKVLLVRSKRI